MVTIPAFDGSVRFREAVRRVARRLVTERGISLNKQATHLNAYISRQMKYRTLPVTEVSHPTWNEFAKPGSRRNLINDGIIDAAWQWMSEEHNALLLHECNIESSTDAISRELNTILFNKSGIYKNRPDDVRKLGGRAYNFVFRVNLDSEKLFCGSMRFSEKDGIMSFILRCPFYDRDGVVAQETSVGVVISCECGFMLIGSEQDKNDPIFILINMRQDADHIYDGSFLRPNRWFYNMALPFVMTSDLENSPGTAIADVTEFYNDGQCYLKLKYQLLRL